eukprot:CAMPEP_0198200008 /NCGR_PEP_ID=MMETSP1445-20131203/3091_1 /TAXON_ID=36898 /ORGANISM="Pyramimonas sp., Strain CCMP2087" /LENGTH=336 /DNA_ID=CAMNT_0043869939 /DNA_START=201 /DNA_END=1211 /DNA_ORIENTATION=-
MKEIVFNTDFQLSLEAFVNLLYGDDEAFYKGYHRMVNKDPNSTVGTWDKTQTLRKRTLTYTPSMPMPKVIRSALGLGEGGVTVQENQQMEYITGASRALMTSTSYPMIKGGERFETKIIIEYTQLTESTCHAEIKVQFTANIWGVSQMLEKFMSEQANDALTHFMEFIYLWLKQMDKGFCILAEISSLDELRQAAPADTDEAASVYDAEFYDATDSGYLTPRVPNNEDELEMEDEKASGIQVTVDSWFMQSVMKDLSALRVTANTMRGVAEVNQHRMDEMQMDLRHLRRSADRTSLLLTAQTVLVIGGVGLLAARHYMPLFERLASRLASSASASA